jgi:hypothetical protein
MVSGAEPGLCYSCGGLVCAECGPRIDPASAEHCPLCPFASHPQAPPMPSPHPPWGRHAFTTPTLGAPRLHHNRLGGATPSPHPHPSRPRLSLPSFRCSGLSIYKWRS